VDADYERVKSAIIYLADGASRRPTLDEVAAYVGLSPYHFQRLFRRWAGVSPKRFMQHLTASRAKEVLRDSTPVLDAAFALGLSGPGRLHDLIVTTEAVTPGEYKTHGEGLVIHYGIHETPFGPCLLGITARGICALRFIEGTDAEAAVAQMESEWTRASIRRDDAKTRAFAKTIFDGLESAVDGLESAVDGLESAVDGHKPASEPLPLFLKGTNFQLKVWEALLRIPDGCLVSYGDLARRLRAPSAARAVAGAVAANPIAYIIPCHRVLRSTGALGGYRWGTERKLVMLERELAAGQAR
jgi:AraC family transcriptional regulator, regulatory protein of adaptative response / methylated-DNA-[protein]-cysteine methyltransferase